MDKSSTSNYQIDINMMELKRITFNSSKAQQIYDNYLMQILAATKKLSYQDQQDILMELNSHIFESLSKQKNDDEVAGITTVITRIGIPEDILKPLVAEKKLYQATQTFNPIHIFQALTLNLSFGFIYVVFFILYFFLLAFVGVIVAKIAYPEHVGLYYKEGDFFQFGCIYNNEHMKQYEVLGNCFIPTTILLSIVFYILITLLLKLKRNLSIVKKNTTLRYSSSR